MITEKCILETFSVVVISITNVVFGLYYNYEYVLVSLVITSSLIGVDQNFVRFQTEEETKDQQGKRENVGIIIKTSCVQQSKEVFIDKFIIFGLFHTHAGVEKAHSGFFH